MRGVLVFVVLLCIPQCQGQVADLFLTLACVTTSVPINAQAYTRGFEDGQNAGRENGRKEGISQGQNQAIQDCNAEISVIQAACDTRINAAVKVIKDASAAKLPTSIAANLNLLQSNSKSKVEQCNRQKTQAACTGAASYCKWQNLSGNDFCLYDFSK